MTRPRSRCSCSATSPPTAASRRCSRSSTSGSSTKANAKLDLFYVEWADWQTQYNLQLLSGDDNVDLITTATDWLFAWENAEKGAFLPLSEEMLQEHAPKTWAQVDADGHWDLTKLDDGQIYFMPEDNFTQYTNHGFFYRGDWATEAGFENGEITKFEDFTKYFEWVKDNKPEAYPWDVAGDADAALTGYIQGHTDFQTIQQVSAGNYYPFQTTEADPYTVTSWYMEGDELLEAAELAKEWNEIGVWREDALNYDGDTREELLRRPLRRRTSTTRRPSSARSSTTCRRSSRAPTRSSSTGARRTGTSSRTS